MAAFNFTGLSAEQRCIIHAGVWSPELGLPKPGAFWLRQMIDRGLLVRIVHPSGDGRFDTFIVPDDVSAAWHANASADDRQVAELMLELFKRDDGRRLTGEKKS